METHPPRPNRALAELLNACQTSPLTDKDGTERTYSDSSDITGVAAAGQARVTERHAARGGRARRGVPSYQIPIWSGNESLGVVMSVEEVAAAVRRAIALLPNQPSGTSRLPAGRSHADLGARRQRLRRAGTPPRCGGLRQRPPSRRGPPNDARTARRAAAESPTAAPASAIAATRPISAQCSRRSHLRRLDLHNL
jgi:hypothetical protein